MAESASPSTRQRKVVVSQPSRVLPREPALQVRVRAGYPEAPELAVHVEQEGAADRSNGPPQRQLGDGAESPGQVQVRRFRRRRGEAVQPEREALEVHADGRGDAAIDDAHPALVHGELGNGDGGGRAARAVPSGAGRGGTARRCGPGPWSQQSGQRQAALLIAFEQEPGTCKAQSVDGDALGPVHVDAGGDSSLDPQHRPLSVADVQPREGGIAAHRRMPPALGNGDGHVGIRCAAEPRRRRQIGLIRREVGALHRQSQVGHERIRPETARDLDVAAARRPERHAELDRAPPGHGDAGQRCSDVGDLEPDGGRDGLVMPHHRPVLHDDLADLGAERRCFPRPRAWRLGAFGRRGPCERQERKGACPVALDSPPRTGDEDALHRECRGPAHLEPGGLDPPGPDELLAIVRHREAIDGDGAVHARGDAGREGLVHAQIRLGHARDPSRQRQDASPGGQLQMRQAQSKLGGRRRRPQHPGHGQAAAVRDARLGLEPGLRAPRPGEVGDARPRLRLLHARALLHAGVGNSHGAGHVESPELHGSVMEPEAGELDADLGGDSEQLPALSPDHGDVLEAAGGVGVKTVVRVHLQRHRGARAAPLEDHRDIRGEVEPDQREVEPLRGHRRPQVDRVEPDVLHVDRDRRPRRHRGADGAPAARARGEVARLDRDLLRGPRPPPGKRPILQGDRAPEERESIHRDVERPAGRPRALEQIRDVEIVGREPHDADDRPVHGELADPEMTAQERGDVEPDLEPLDVGERGLSVALAEMKAAHGDLALEKAEIDAVDGDRPTGDAVDTRDGCLAYQLRQRVERGGDDDQQDAQNCCKPAA